MNLMSIAEIAIKDYPETRVGYVIPLIQTLIANRTLYQCMSNKDADFAKLFEKLAVEDWQMLAEIEGILHPIFVQSTSTAQQNNASNTSLNPYYRRRVLRILEQESFGVMDIDHKCGISSSVKNWPRKAVKKDELGFGGKVGNLSTSYQLVLH